MYERHLRRASEPTINRVDDQLINQSIYLSNNQSNDQTYSPSINQLTHVSTTRRLTGDSQSLMTVLSGFHTPETRNKPLINQSIDQTIDQTIDLDDTSPLSDHLVTIPLNLAEPQSDDNHIPVRQTASQSINQTSHPLQQLFIDPNTEQSSIPSFNRLSDRDHQHNQSFSEPTNRSRDHSLEEPLNDSYNTQMGIPPFNRANTEPIKQSSHSLERRPSLNAVGHPDHPAIVASCGPDDVTAELEHEHPERNLLITTHYTSNGHRHYHVTPLDPERTFKMPDNLLSLRGLASTSEPSPSSMKRYGSGHSIEPGHSHGPVRRSSFTQLVTQPAKPSEALHETSSHADLSKIDDQILTTDPRQGLSDDVVTERLHKFGLNEITETKTNPIKKFLMYFTGSIAYLIEFAAIMSAVLKDWMDFGIIAALLLLNALIGFVEEARAESAVAALKSTLALRCRVKRNGQMIETEAKKIVPGDVISLRTGDVISADCVVLPQVKKRQVWTGLPRTAEEQDRLLHPEHHESKSYDEEDEEEDENIEMTADQSALTGESLPSIKHPFDLLYSSSIIKSGQAEALVLKTGEKTFIGRAANLINITKDAGHFQKIIERIGNFLVFITVIMVGILLIIGCTIQGHSFTKQLRDCLVIAIAAIPVGLPSVLATVMAVGSRQLAAKNVIVKRLTAVEEMAGVNVLCSDKTGTLTMNHLQMDRPYLPAGCTVNDLLMCGFLASEHATKDAIDLCLREAACAEVPELHGLTPESSETPGYRVIKHVPFTSTTKIATSTLKSNETNETFVVAKGAPQVILNMCQDANVDQANAAISDMAKKGLRALGVARSAPFQGRAPFHLKTLDWHLIGIVSLLDPPRSDSKETIRECAEYGIPVKMITGDQLLIAREVARRLGMDRCILSPEIIQNNVDHAGRAIDDKRLTEMVQKCDGFAQVVPEDKYRVVELLQKAGKLLIMTGDGANDGPALAKANVGIAVSGCTDAARAAASIVLLEPGLSTIVDGVLTSRAIFQRMRSYALYRITSTIHFLIFLFIAILAYDFRIPAILIVLITVMNDAATLVISVDNAVISKHPDKWRIGQLISLSFLLAILLAASSFAHFFVFRDALGFTTAQLATVMYLQLSSCPHFVIFSTRVPGPFWERAPSCLFFWAVMGTQIVAMFFAIYGVVSAPIGWPASVSIMCISLLYFMVLDQVKLFVYKIWSYKLTVALWPTRARRALLKQKIAAQETQQRYSARCRQARRIVNACKFILLAKQSQLQQISVDQPVDQDPSKQQSSKWSGHQSDNKSLRNGNKVEGNDKHENIKFHEWNDRTNYPSNHQSNHQTSNSLLTNEDIEMAQWP